MQRLLIVSHGEIPATLREILNRHDQISVQSFSPVLMSNLCYGQQETEPVAIACEPHWDLKGLQLTNDSLVLVLDQTEKPGNLGACLRSAVACGCSAVLLTRPICDAFSSNSIRASRGAIFQLPMAVATPEEVIELAQAKEIPIYAARVGEQIGLWDLKLATGAFLVFGNEARGLDDRWQQASIQGFSIPMQGCVDSLNLSISAAIAMFEVVRQKAAIRI